MQYPTYHLLGFVTVQVNDKDHVEIVMSDGGMLLLEISLLVLLTLVVNKSVGKISGSIAEHIDYREAFGEDDHKDAKKLNKLLKECLIELTQIWVKEEVNA